MLVWVFVWSMDTYIEYVSKPAFGPFQYSVLHSLLITDVFRVLRDQASITNGLYGDFEGVIHSATLSGPHLVSFIMTCPIGATIFD